MAKIQKIKLEFTSNTTQSFDFNTDNCNIIDCVVKSAGKINNDFFTAKYKFTIDAQVNSIIDIHFFEIKHINDNEEEKENNSKISINSTLEETFEQIIYNNLSNMLLNAIVNNNTITLNNLDINFLVLHIKIGSNKYNSESSTDEETISNKIEELVGPMEPENNNNIQKSKSSSSKISESGKIHKTPKKSKKTKTPQDTLKLVAWSSMITFMMHIFKSKIHNKKN